MLASMERFWSKVEKRGPRECWMWQGAHVGQYGSFWYGAGPERAHRVAWELANGRAIPDGLIVMHACDNPLCVNPKHLVLGTRQANNYDRDQKGRQRTKRGSAHRLAKLTDADVLDIRARLAAGETQIALARAHGVAKSLVSRIARRVAWPHVG